jgi:glutamate decarboxylase
MKTNITPGIGWAIWRDSKALPESMIFYADYLGSLERTITLNFSRGASHIIAQYYQFLRLGVEGYKKIMNNLINITEYTTARLKKTGYFDILSTRQGIPLVAFKLKKAAAYTESDLADRVRMTGFVIPAYSMPKGQENKKMMRITIREDFSMTLAEEVIDALTEATDWLEKHYACTPSPSLVAQYRNGYGMAAYGSPRERCISNSVLDFYIGTPLA